ncbi:hypothetical protein SLS61_008154 [Didymella pomorum]
MLELSRQNSGSVKKQFDAYKKRNKSKAPRTPAPATKRKRRNSAVTANTPPKKLKRDYGRSGWVPKVGDWKCELGGFWNKPVEMYCGGRAEGEHEFKACRDERDLDSKIKQHDDGLYEKYRE